MKSPVYRQDVIDFVTVSVQTCLLLEQATDQTHDDFVDKLCKLLPLLYLKTRMLTSVEPSEDAEVQAFTTEEDYNMVSFGVRQLLGSDDAYMEVFVEDMRYSDTPITCFISEDLADIYQPLKDMALNYQTQVDDTMYEAVSWCLVQFRQYWGQKLLNVLRPLHALSYNTEE